MLRSKLSQAEKAARTRQRKTRQAFRESQPCGVPAEAGARHHLDEGSPDDLCGYAKRPSPLPKAY